MKIILFPRHACKDFPNFKSFKIDQQQSKDQQQQQQQHQQQQKDEEPQRTATLGKYSSLGRRPLPQTPDEKARSKPPMPKVPVTISGTIPENSFNPSNYRSLQRGGWQDSMTSTFQPGNQFRSLQRGVQPSQFRFNKMQQQQEQGENNSYTPNEENERHLYAVTEL
ncbi:hypothetical protein ABEB36_009759 [Hypothenemus hampei]|uniref:Uncharacterized protein n=1 Tax=Hypothenemus hampei TaxID=57062 RepID=A0ABD1EJI3_HYPHA